MYLGWFSWRYASAFDVRGNTQGMLSTRDDVMPEGSVHFTKKSFSQLFGEGGPVYLQLAFFSSDFKFKSLRRRL